MKPYSNRECVIYYIDLKVVSIAIEGTTYAII